MLREIRIDTPVAHRVGIGQSVASNVAAETEMVELRRLRAKTSLNVTQALTPGQLREGETEILVQA
jgi:hypothetical protein